MRRQAPLRAAFLSFALSFLFAAVLSGQENPFTGRGAAEPQAALELGGIGDFFMGLQSWFNRQIGEQLTLDPASRQSGFLIGLLGVTFLYGIFHSLGPGHRKTVLFSWIVARSPSVPAIFGVSALLSFFHFLGTGLIILLAAVARDLLGRSLSDSQNILHLSVQSISAVAVAILGIVLLRQALGHSHHHDHSHDHDHEVSEDGGDRPEPRSMFLVAFSQGLVPCPGSLSILAVSLILGDLGVGFAAVLSISLGMLATLFALGLAVRFLLRGMDVLGARGGRLGKAVAKIMLGLQVSAAVLVLVYGIVWLGTGLVGLATSVSGS